MRIKVYRKVINRGEMYPSFVETEATRTIASVFSNKGPLRGLSPQEEKRFLTDYLDISADDNDYHKETKKFWVELRINIPEGGRIFDMSKDMEGYPVNLKDYIEGKFIMCHPLVGTSKEEMEGSYTKGFYYTTDEIEKRIKSQNTVKMKAAYTEFLKITDSEQIMNYVLSIICKPEEIHNIEKMDKDEKETYIDSYVRKNPEEFYRVVTDKNLKRKAEIEAMLKLGIISKIGNDYTYIEEYMGSNINEAISYMSSPTNSKKILNMRLELKSLSKNLMGFNENKESFNVSDEQAKDNKKSNKFEKVSDNVPKPYIKEEPKEEDILVEDEPKPRKAGRKSKN